MNIFLRKTEDRSKPNRRDFMLQTGCATLGLTSLVNTVAQLKMVGAAAASGGPGDYKALICLFMNGGMDSNNFLIPAGSSTARTDYENGRGFLAIPDSNFDYTPRNASNGYWNGTSVSSAPVSTRITPANIGAYDPPTRTSGYCGTQMALHPGAYPLAKMFTAGDLAFVGNIGTLTQPGVTRANFSSAGTPKPPQLFSHSDQQTQWQSSLPDKPFTSGWGGRIADLLTSQGANAGDLSLSVSIAGVNSLQVGVQVQPYIMNSSGSVSSLSGYGSPYTSALRYTNLQPDYTNPAVVGPTKYNPMAALRPGADPLAGTNYQHNQHGWRLRAVEQILAMSHASLFDDTYVDVPQSARVTEGLVGNALAQTATPNPTLDVHFTNWFPSGLYNPQITDFASQLRVVARMIAGRSVLGNTRQIFFVQLGGWDTHTSQIPTTAQPEVQGQYTLINNLSRAVAAFSDAMKAIGMWDNVVMFSASDFSRTMNANKADSTAGSDHAWGGNAFLAGGAVNGGKIYGKFANLLKNTGIDCVGNSGRWIPNVAVDQYAATIAKWFGVTDAQLPAVFPNLGRFMPGGITNSELTSRNLDMITFA
jgi:uncharacterized protein (DUF1501 family)